MLGLLLAMGVLLAGRVRRWPAGQVGGLLAGLLGILILIHSPLLPAGNPLARVLGGDLRGWLLLAVLSALVLAYREGLGRLRARVQPPAPVPAAPFLSDAEATRYSRHILLREIGGTGQRRLKDARVLVVGAGGLGSPALLYLGAAGVGTLGVIDDDVVEPSNLQRQIIHADQRLGMPKVHSAAEAVRALNPYVTVLPYRRRLDAETAAALFPEYDLILDGSDTFATRSLVNAAAVAARVPLVSGALTQWEGQVAVFDPSRGGPCRACVFPEDPAPGLAPACAEAGVLAPLPGVIGSMMAVEAVKHLTGAGEALRGRLMLYDAMMGEVRVITVPRRATCAVCGTG